jgi:hypothetical protein
MYILPLKWETTIHTITKQRAVNILYILAFSVLSNFGRNKGILYRYVLLVCSYVRISTWMPTQAESAGALRLSPERWGCERGFKHTDRSVSCIQVSPDLHIFCLLIFTYKHMPLNDAYFPEERFRIPNFWTTAPIYNFAFMVKPSDTFLVPMSEWSFFKTYINKLIPL